MNNTKMLYLKRTDVFKRTDFNKTGVSNECNICHYWYFLNKGFKFQLNACIGCHYLLMMPINFSDVPILKVENTNYDCVITGINKSKAKKLLQNIDLTEKSVTY